MRLFNLGLPKSGTTTLQAALTRSGLKAAHWTAQKTTRFGRKKTEFYVGQSIYSNYLLGRDPLFDLKHFDAITQADVIMPPFSLWPQMDMALLAQIRHHHPDCLFILLKRNPEKVADSIKRWYDMQDRFSALGAPGLLPQKAASFDGMVAWINGHYKDMNGTFGQTAQYLELDIEDDDAPDQLGKALGITIKWWGRENVNQPTAL